MKLLAALGLLSVLGSCLWETANVPQERPVEPFFLIIEEKAAPAAQKRTTLQLLTAEGVRETDEEEYLTCVVLSELPASFHEEAMKAQAVAARTYAFRAVAHGKHTDADLCSDPACCQAYHAPAELRERLGDAFDAAWEKASEAVRETDGMILCYGDEPIDAVYYSCSGGRSEDAVAVWGGDVPYLRSVDSPGEEFAPRFASEICVPFSEFRAKLEGEEDGLRLPVLPQDWFGEASYTEGGAIDTIRIGGKAFRGTELRRLFTLPSAKFTVSIRGDAVVFSCRGYGHGVGMSQYGAEAMAREGKDWRQIVAHYYTGVEIKKLSRQEAGQRVSI
ncbi:MAG: stage II sporulation protein D [Oscillospiraceae bacterium]|nr:stage II sporulation protein D [Oscillospiraceae bacterium]